MKQASNRKPDDFLRQLQRATAIGPLIAAGIQHAPPSLLDGLDGDLQQIRDRVAKTWPHHRLAVIKTAKKPWDDLASGKLLGTLKQRAEAQLGACAGFVQAAVEARDKGNGWHSPATIAAVSILRLHGAVDALEITRDTLTGPTRSEGHCRQQKKGAANERPVARGCHCYEEGESAPVTYVGGQ